MAGITSLEDQGYAVVPGHIPREVLEELRNTLFQNESAGERCLLDHPIVGKAALLLRHELVRSGHLDPAAVAIQAIIFNKTPATNWKVAWHQDLMFPFAKPVTADGFDLPTRKKGIDHARPPQDTLKQLLAARLHLDDCDFTNGPLRISPGTHRLGILETAEISRQVTAHGKVACLAKTGEVLLMRPLAIHASSQALAPKNRRILHLVYHSGAPTAEPWHRALRSLPEN